MSHTQTNKPCGYDDKYPEHLSRGHVWIMYDVEEGETPDTVDIMAFSEDRHNGPRCATCGYGYCHHCFDGPQVDCTGSPRESSYDDSKLTNPFLALGD